ncbi:MAG TPA: pyridoxamine 5'-phosphate oxidase family protein [Candidatus Binatia bacterium]|nr:pyridoxamine 5'-phosphate oxidase family protein [Candidatus Binatia bacterium]
MPSLIDATVHAFLQRSLIVQVATLSPKGRPFVTPLWFVVHRGVIYITTGAATRAGKNITHHPEVALLFGAEPAGQQKQVLRIKGTAACHPGLPPWGVLLRIAAKYYLAPRAAYAELRNANKWRLRQHYYGQNTGGVGHIGVIPISCEFLTVPRT